MRTKLPIIYFLVFCFLITGYAIIQADMYLNLPYIPDEKRFANHIAHYHHSIGAKFDDLGGNIRAYLTLDPALGYGSGYWAVHYWLTHSTSKLDLIRLFYLILVLSIPLILFVHSLLSKSKYKYLPVYTYLSFPIAWWYGKITGPEPLSIWFSLVGLLMLLSDKKALSFLGWLLLGIGFGVKSTIFPIILFITFIYLAKYRLDIISYISCLALPIGFLIANPFLASGTGLKNFLNSVSTHSHSGSFSWNAFLSLVSREGTTWEGLPNWGFLHWGFGIVGLLFFLAFLHINKLKNHLYSFVFCTIFSLILISSTIAYGWYCHPIWILVPVILLQIKIDFRTKDTMLYLTIVFGSMTSFKFIAKSYVERVNMIEPELHTTIQTKMLKVLKPLISS